MIRGIPIWFGAVVALAVIGTGVAFLLNDEDDITTYRMPSPSMEPTFEMGEKFEADLGAYDGAKPQIGDVITFRPPLGAERGSECGAPTIPGQVCTAPTPKPSNLMFVKRVVALPGDELTIEDGVPVVNGKPAEEDFTKPCGGAAGGGCDFPKPATIAPGHYFVLGDNRPKSSDSRYWGPVPLEWIEGRAVED